MEEWRDIQGYEGLYQVSNCGRVKSIDRILPNGKTHKGRVLYKDKLANAYSTIKEALVGESRFVEIEL